VSSRACLLDAWTAWRIERELATDHNAGCGGSNEYIQVFAMCLPVLSLSEGGIDDDGGRSVDQWSLAD